MTIVLASAIENSTSVLTIVCRLGLAVLVGSLLGLNRDLHGKPAGLRTHALVTLGAAMEIGRAHV